MLSNQWEVVTKSKKIQKLEKKKEERAEKKRIEAIIRLEEILPANEYRKIINQNSNVSPAESTSSSVKSKSPKKTVKNVNYSNSKEQKSSSKQKQSQKQQNQQIKVSEKPRSLEAALRKISPDEFNTQLEKLKILFPGSELQWLRGISNYLNSNLAYECDPLFSGKSHIYPSNLISEGLRAAIVDFLDSVGVPNLTYFYHLLLSSMASEMLKNLPVVGYKLMLQLIAQNWPEICTEDMAKTAMLRNSYQNRANVCLSILWSIGQGGYQKLNEGVKTWQNLMLPNLEMKNYTKFVVDYIERVLNVAKDQSLNLNQTEFLLTYNALKMQNTGFPKAYQESLANSAHLFLQKYIAFSERHANLFYLLLRDIESTKKNRLELHGCISCLSHGEDAYKVWKMNYKNQLVPTLLLLREIDQEWDGASSPLKNSTWFHKFLLDAKQLNLDMETTMKQEDSHLMELSSIVESLQEKVTQHKKKQSAAEQKKKCGCCKWMLGSFVLFALIIGAISYDTQVNGKGVFERSALGKSLKNAGLLPYVEKAWYTSLSTSARAYKWAEVNVPPYATPLCHLICDLTKLLRNAACNAFTTVRELVNGKLPVASEFVEQYVPGLPDKIGNAWEATKGAVCNVCEKTVVFFQDNVFIGRLSPENLNKALNDTQNAALEYYNVFHKKVDAYAKLK